MNELSLLLCKLHVIHYSFILFIGYALYDDQDGHPKLKVEEVKSQHLTTNR